MTTANGRCIGGADVRVTLEGRPRTSGRPATVSGCVEPGNRPTMKQRETSGNTAHTHKEMP